MMQKIGDLAEVRKGKSLAEDPKGEHFQVWAAAIAFDGYIDRTMTKKVRISEDDTDCVLLENDLVLTVDGTLDKVAIVDRPGCVCGGTCVLIRPKLTEDGLRIFRYLRSSEGKKKMAGLKRGVTIPHINISDIREIEIP